MSNMVKVNPRIDIPCPKGRQYQPYQLAGIRYALGARGTLLADEMGLGKTVQAIGVMNALHFATRKALGRDAYTIIVTPAGLRLNWLNELDDWSVNGPCFSAVTYHQADDADVLWGQCGRKRADLLVVDEAHYIKNPESQRSQNIDALAKQADRVILMTGTPIENRPIELWPLVKIVAPLTFDPPHLHALTVEKKVSHPGQGPGFWAFAKRYCDLKRSKTFNRRGHGPMSAWDFSGASNLDELRLKLKKSCMVRRLKKDVLTELPPKRHQVIVLPIPGLKPDDDLIPGLTEDNYYEAIAELTPGKALFDEYSRRRHIQALEKLDACLRVIGDALDESRKIIIFAHHADVVSKLSACVDAEFSENAYSVTITGQTPIADRQRYVEQFQNDPECRVIIGSIGALGVGWTLTAASHVIFVELDPRPGAMNQAIDRAHRIGTTATMILVWYLVADRTLCARMAKIIVKKQDVINQALDGE